MLSIFDCLLKVYTINSASSVGGSSGAENVAIAKAWKQHFEAL